MKLYNILFNGYIREENKEYIPSFGGIYIVYRCVFNKKEKKISLKELIYIGRAVNINNRISKHERRADFLKTLSDGEELCYSYSSIAPGDIDIIENALIFMQKPRLNDELKNEFNYSEAAFHIEGRCGLLEKTDFEITLKSKELEIKQRQG